MKNFFLLSIFALFSVILTSQDKGSDLLKSVQEKFNSVSDMSADVKQVSNGKTTFSGKVYFKKGNMFRAEFSNNTLVSNGSTTWNYNKKENKVVIDQFDSSNPSALSLNTVINDYPSKSEVKASTEGGKSTLTLTPKKNSGLSFKQAKLWVNSNNLVERVTVTNAGGNTMNIEISNYKLNQNLPDSQFTFNPPQGTTVIDLR